MRLIDADALLKDINDYPYGYRGMIKDTIARQPTVEPKRGYWVQGNRDFLYACSNCKEMTVNAIFYGFNGEKYMMNYCPHCGAKMEVEE